MQERNWRIYPLARNTPRVAGSWRVRKASGSAFESDIWKIRGAEPAMKT